MQQQSFLLLNSLIPLSNTCYDLGMVQRLHDFPVSQRSANFAYFLTGILLNI